MTLCPMLYDFLYYWVNNRESQLLMLLTVGVGVVFIMLILILSVMIAMIDVMAKEGIHPVYGHSLSQNGQ